MKPITQFELAWLAERTGEEDAEHVDADTATKSAPPSGGSASTRRPPRDRTQTCSVDSSCRHLDAAHRSVGTGVVRLDHRRVEEERQEHSVQEHDHEAPQRDLAEINDQWLRGRSSTELLDEAGEAGVLIDVVRRGADEAAAERGLVVLVLFWTALRCSAALPEALADRLGEVAACHAGIPRRRP